ncbi:MAG: histidine--tRNA ligase [Candidatus Syntrophosphaera sp.]|jgi:histidyl-tRNA synthetase|nr:histidine--tRNA ligase [Candidatus Syntrophosphaera sp.]
MQYSIPRGTYDILPEESPKWHKVIAEFRKLVEAYGYAEILTPIFEQADLFERSSGKSSDVVKKEMYRFTDRKGREFALRPEGTAPVARSYIENRMDIGSLNKKLYYLGPMFRYDRPQAGRYRQFYQYGVEFIGSNHPYYDAEVIAILWNYLTGLGLKKLRLELNSVGCPNCSKDYDKALQSYFQPYLNQLCPDCQERFERKPRRILDCKVKECQEIAKNVPVQLDYLDTSCIEHFAEVQQYLDLMKIPFTINPRIVRGLDYYTNTAFEVIYEGIGAQNALAGGGRYNGLIEQIGGKNIPAVGFAGGFERLLLALEEEAIALPGHPVPEVFIITIGSEAQKIIIPYLNIIRGKGIYAEYEPDRASLKAQLKAANNSKAFYALIMGEEEVKQKSAILKNLESGEQKLYSLEPISHLIKAIQDKEI